MAAALLGAAWATPALSVDLPPTTGPAVTTAAPPAPAPGTAPVPTPQPVAAVALVRLRLGSRGPLVRDLQRELRRRGAVIRVDGVFGPTTRRAVMRQQARLRLPVTGVADARLLTRLGLQSVRVAAVAPAPVAVPLRMDRWPTTGRFESPFGPRWGRMHEGIDISNDTGTPVVAALGGVVRFVGVESGYGTMVVVDHGVGVSTAYAHLSGTHVVEGQAVLTGDLLGDMGATGSATGVHLHFEVRLNDAPLDPLTALPPRPAAVLPAP